MYAITDIIDFAQLQRLMKAYYAATGIPIGMLDAQGQVRVSAGWQGICSDFHRKNSTTAQRCQESDNYIKTHLHEGRPVEYRCQNGLWEIAIPVVIQGEHVATLFLGQFFYDDDPPDYSAFRNQARRFDFDEDAYLEALAKVPVFSRQHTRDIIEFYIEFVRTLVAMGITRLRQAQTERELRWSEEKYRLVADFTYDWEYWVSPEGEFRYVSPSCERVTGYRPEEFTADPSLLIRILHPADLDSISRHFRRSLENHDETGVIEFRLVRKDGEERWIEHICHPVFSRDGSWLGRRASNRDVTAKRLAEEMLGITQAAVDHAVDAIFWINADGSLLYANDAAVNSLGYRKEELLALHVYDFDFSASEDAWNSRWNQLKSKRFLQYETLQRCADGSTFPVDITMFHLEHVGKEYACAFARDIRERKKSENALRMSEDRYRRMTQAVVDYVYSVRVENGHPLETVHGPGCVAVTGYTTEDFAANPFLWYEMVDMEDRAFVLEQARMVLEGEAFQPLEHRIRHKNGQIRWVRNTPVPHYDAEGRLTAYDGLVRDITDRLAAEEDRRKMEARVQHAQKMESLGVLAGGVAHDFNNLLMGVLGNAELALMDLPKHSTVRSYIKDVIKAAQRAADLSRQMLAYSGQGRLEIEAVDMTDLISEMSSLLGASVGRQAEIVCDLEEGLPSVEGDSTQLRQVIMNLVINAAEAMENSMGVITVSTNLFTSEVAFHAGSELEEELPAGDYLCLQVRDTGCGMDETTASRIFDPFFTTKFTGRGLGLASVLGIVRGHNGGVRVFSAPGKGSTISVYLPIIPESANQISRMLPAASLELNVLHAGGWHGSGTVLFVDDEELVRVVGRQILEKAGFNVITTCTGVEAIEVLQGNPDAIDCVLLDLTMPGMDGVETCYRMKMLRPDLPVILASGYHEQELARRYSDAGFSEFIQKPFTVESLISRLCNVLQ